MTAKSVDAADKISPITVEVIGSTFESVVDEMVEALVRASHSTNIKERRDCSAAIMNVEGELLCQGEHIPIHLGSFLSFVSSVLKVYQIETIRPGDVFVGNDAYQGGGTHLPDIILAQPVFFEQKIAAWVLNAAHHADFTDRGHAHIFQEGLRIPPIRLYKQGSLQEEIQNLILLNCQVPTERISDLRAQMAACRVGVSGIEALLAKYGAKVVNEVSVELLDYSARLIREEIKRIPDGVYTFEDVLDARERSDPMPMATKIVVAGDTMRLHFDSPPQIRGSLNVVYTALQATVYYAVKTLLGPSIPANAGIGRALTITAGAATVLNCAHPAAVYGRALTCQRVVDLIYGALADALPDRVPAAANGSANGIHFVGVKDDGSLWIYGETVGGGSGARYNKNGLDGVHVHMTDTSNLPVEALEPEYPITVLKYELVDGSGGHGKHRGGMGIRRLYRAEADCRIGAAFGTRMRSRPWGLQGGHGGQVGYIRFHKLDGSWSPNADSILKGELVEIVTPGGGGYGDPKQRSVEEVRLDIRDRIVTPDVAAEYYPID